MSTERLHVKRQILHMVRDALVQHLPEHEVHLDRLDPLPARRCPAVLVREDERGGSIRQATTEGLQQRTLLVSMSCCVALSEGYGEAADALGLQVEQLFGACLYKAAPLVQRLCGVCNLDIELKASRMFMSGEGETAVAVLMQTWQFPYAVYPDRPDVAIP